MTATDLRAPAPRHSDEAVPVAPALAPRPWWALALPGLVVGLVSALWGLGARAFWLDEAYSLGAIHQMRRTLPDTHGTMAGYYTLLRPWAAVSESVAWMRGLSVLCALVAVAVVVTLARRTVGERSALLAGLLTALSPLWLSYAREARSYALVMALVAVSWLALDHGLDPDRPAAARRWWWLHTAVCLVLPLCHGLTALQVLPQVAVLVVAGAPRATWWRAGRGVALTVAVTAALLTGGANSVGDWVSPLSPAQAGETIEAFLSPVAVLAGLLLSVVLAGVVLAVGNARRVPAGRDRARALLPVAWGVAPLVLLVVLSVARESLVPRYAIGCVPGLALLMVTVVEAVGGRFGGRRVVRVGAVALVVVPLLVGHLRIHDEPEDGWTFAARTVADNIRPGDTILLSRVPTTRPPFEAAWRDVDPDVPDALIPLDRPLGEVLRFEPDEAPGTVRWNQARQLTGRIFVVADAQRLELDRLPSLTTDGVADRSATHREVRRWVDRDTGDVTVVLLEPKPAR